MAGTLKGTLSIIEPSAVRGLQLPRRAICFNLWTSAGDDPRDLASAIEQELLIQRWWNAAPKPPQTTNLHEIVQSLLFRADSSPTEFWLLWSPHNTTTESPSWN